MLKLNRIGNKLGLAGAVGVLLAAGMVANQMITETSIEQASDRASRSQRVADNSLSAHIDLRKIQLAARDVRLARTSAEVDKTIADLQRFKASEAKELEAALSAAHGQDTRERLQKIKSLMEGFTAAVEDLAKAQITLLEQIDKRSAVSDEWTKSLEAQLTSPALTKLDLLRYLARVSRFMLPHLADRPLTMIRMPEGNDRERCLQKHWDQARPEGVRTVRVF